MDKHTVQVTVLSRQNCHLCDVVLKIAKRLQAEAPFDLTKVDIGDDVVLTRAYGDRIPVVLIDGVEACAGKVTEGALRRAIKRARWSRPISRILSRLGLGSSPSRG
jgi:hypothetical protein